MDQYTPTPRERALQSGLTEYVIRSGEAKLISQAQLLELIKTGVVDRVQSSLNHSSMSTSWLGAPSLVGPQVLGVIALQCYDNTYSYSEQGAESSAFCFAAYSGGYFPASCKHRATKATA